MRRGSGRPWYAPDLALDVGSLSVCVGLIADTVGINDAQRLGVPDLGVPQSGA